MMRSISAFTIGVALLSFAACSSGQQKNPNQRLIRVRVINKLDGSAVSAAQVWLEVFQPGKGFQMGHFERIQSVQTDTHGEATLITSEPDPLQIGASACEDFLAQGMTVIPPGNSDELNVTVPVALQYCKKK